MIRAVSRGMFMLCRRLHIESVLHRPLRSAERSFLRVVTVGELFEGCSTLCSEQEALIFTARQLSIASL